jgi:5'-deoxynucleotidase YfbR-like HD superfamily hydrolase/DNA-binding transcriptional regulator YhcF (GntR family)
METPDKSDPRPVYIKIAASVRASILSGEFEPGQRLPSGEELAEFFHVTRATVASAVRVLRDEGFIRSLAGSGVYVRDAASLPVPQPAHPLAGVAAFLHETGYLKQLPRTGWLMLGITQPESVAEHSFRVGMTGMVLAALAGADVAHTAALALMHDVHESRVGDIASVGRAYLTAAAPEAVTAHQTAGMPAGLAKQLQELTAEYEAAATLEAQLARDADKIETLLQALEYGAQGHSTGPWQETSVTALRTDAGRQLAEAITAGSPHDWTAPFQASYHELRASAKQRGHGLEAGPAGDAAG